MKIMDLPDQNDECQIEVDITPKTKKSNQARLPFQTLSADVPVSNKKRKSISSPDCSRNAKQPKVDTKENSFKKSEKTEIEDIIVTEKNNDKTDININEVEDVKDGIKQVEETANTKIKKSTGKNLGKIKKSDTKIQVNSLTKFLKKVDKNSKEAKNANESLTNTFNEKDQNINEIQETNYSPDILNTSENNKSNENVSNSETVIEVDEKSEESNDMESNDICLNNADKSQSNDIEKMDMDSDINLISDDSPNEDDDSAKSDTDSKKTEHEDTDSKDDVNKTNETQLSTPTRSKLLNSSNKIKKLTPKQIEKKLEIQKKRESREKQRLEREKKLQEEREHRKKEKEDKKREREEKEKVLKEQKKKEKEIKELKKQADMELKQKEKEAKEEDRRKREEEKKRKEEEKLELERKKLKAASNFASFFVAKKPTDVNKQTLLVKKEKKIETRNFMPFEIKADMRVAPHVRRNLNDTDKSTLDRLIESNSMTRLCLYLSELKTKKFDIRKCGRTWPFEANDDIVIIDEEEESQNVVQGITNVREKHRAKLLLFEDNRRPPYWGTWRKKSKTITPRKPFAKDLQIFDYEVDSDDEWEEEEPGESLHGSDDEKEKDEDNTEENEYDVDNDFMVPHGYLSEEEIGADEEDDESDLNPEVQKTKLKILGEQFEAERKTKTQKLKPKVIGCNWLNANNAYPENMPLHAVNFLTIRHTWVREIPLILTPPAESENATDENGIALNKHGAASSARKAQVMQEAMPDLIRMLHGNPHSRVFLVKEFLEFWNKKHGAEKPISKMRLSQNMREIATWKGCPDPGPMQDKFCWYVTEEYRTKYLGEEKLTLPNQWAYCLTPKKRKILAETIEKSEDREKEREKEKEKEKEKKLVPLITQYTKHITPEEMQKKLAEKTLTPSSKALDKTFASTSATKATPPSTKAPKRVALISLPRLESIPKSPRVSLIDKFVTKDNPKADVISKKDKTCMEDDADSDDCMVIDNSDEKIDVLNSSMDNEKKVDNSKNKILSKTDGDALIKCEGNDKSVNVSSSSEVDVIEL